MEINKSWSLTWAAMMEIHLSTTKQKKNIMETILSKTKIFALALATIFTTGLGFIATASDDVKKPEEVKYVGNLNDLPVYQLALNNDVNNTYKISIKDGEGNVLHSEKIEGKAIVRNYQLEDAPADAYSLTFEVFNFNNNSSNVYKINKTKKTLDKVEVNKVK